MPHKIGVADTTHARVDMARYCIDAIRSEMPSATVVRYTVPGIKDLPAAAKRLLDDGCEVALALGMPGKTPLDKACAHEASLGLLAVQVSAGKHVLEVFVHEDEAEDERKLLEVAVDRARKHGVNACKLLRGRDELTRWAGMGLRQGLPDVGPILAGR